MYGGWKVDGGREEEGEAEERGACGAGRWGTIQSILCASKCSS